MVRHLSCLKGSFTDVHDTVGVSPLRLHLLYVFDQVPFAYTPAHHTKAILTFVVHGCVFLDPCARIHH